MYKLPKDFKEKWITSLRSGEYEQGRYILLNENLYSCLGVAEKIAGSEDKYICRLYNAFSDFVPKEILAKTSLSKELIRLNDDLKFSFKEIANWIEENVEGY